MCAAHGALCRAAGARFQKEHGAALCAALLFYSEDTMDKVLLILVDGMRPDSIAACGSEYADNMLKTAAIRICRRKRYFRP